MKRSKWALLLILSPAASVLFSNASHAQVVTGHYQPLFASGLKSGVLPSGPRTVYQNSTLFYHASDFRNGDGNSISGVDELNIIANRNSFVRITSKKLFGADYGMALAIPISNLAPNPVVIDSITQNAGIGLGDIAVAPLVLGWHWPEFQLQGGYTVFVPVGRFELGAQDNTGKGFWTHMLNVGGTWIQRGDQPWHVSLMTRYEIHSNQEGRDLRPGDTLTFEFGIGKSLRAGLDAGLVAHHWRQVTDTSGADAMPTAKYQSSGIGAELQWVIASKYAAKFRIGADFEARNVSQGPFIVFELNIPL